MSRHRIVSASVATLALGIATTAWAQSAQATPTTPSPDGASPEYRGPDPGYHQPPPIVQDDTPHPGSVPPPPTSTTQTTSAEYVENAGAEPTTGSAYSGPSRALLGTGAVLVIAPYVAGVIVAAASPLEEDKRLYIPVAGPWLDLGQRPCSFGSGCSTGDNIGSTLLIASGVAQAAGVIMMATSLAAPEHPTRIVAKHDNPHVSVMPVSYAGGGGLGAYGTF